MRSTILLILFALAAVHASEQRSVLFIGNSLTAYNALPTMFASLAAAGGQGEIAYDSELVGGATLAKHWKDGKALQKLQSRAWTWVVIQEYSFGTIKNAESFITHGRLFIDAITDQRAKPVLYMTWARLGEMDTQGTIADAYRTLGAATGAQVVPAGLAFKTYREQHGDGALFKDNRHPKPIGTYLVACCFYSALFAADPSGLPGDAAKLDVATAAELQRIAWATR